MNMEIRRLSYELDGLKSHLHQLVFQSSLVVNMLKIDAKKVAETAASLHLGLTDAEKNSPSWARRSLNNKQNHAHQVVPTDGGHVQF